MEKDIEKEEQKKIIKEIEKIYTPLSKAKKELEKRWKDKKLRDKVNIFLGEDIPDFFKNGPTAIIFRNIATPNFELELAFEHAKMMGLNLAVVEYTADRFCTRNHDKLCLGKMIFFDKKKSQIVAKEKIIAIKEDDNKSFTEIKTLWKEDLVDFHHRILRECEYKNVRIFDMSIYKNKGLDPYEIYLKVMGFCVQSAVLLENFIIKTNKGEKKFVEQVIFPAFKEAEKALGYRPMIVPIIGFEDEDVAHWQYYAEKVKNNFKKA